MSLLRTVPHPPSGLSHFYSFYSCPIGRLISLNPITATPEAWDDTGSDTDRM